MNSPARGMRSLILALVGALALGLAPAAAAHAAGQGTITATITSDGDPVVGAFVSLEGPEPGYAFTDENGVAAFSALALGDHTVVVPSGPLHPETRTPVTLTAAEPNWSGVIELDDWPIGTASIATTVADAASGAPVADVRVEVHRTDGPAPYIQGFTDATGTFVATGLVPGAYAISTGTTSAYFGTYGEIVVVVEGQAASLDLRPAPRDAAIEGRVVGPDGVGIPNVTVSAEVVDTNIGTAAVTDATGAYRIDGAIAGTWRLRTYADADWEASATTVVVTAGSTLAAPDIALTPRITGTLSGLVASADGIPESTIGGFFDVCVTVIGSDGTPVDGAETTTGGDSFFAFFLQPGQYTVRFDDCATDRQPHGYGSVYLGGSATLAGATFVGVTTGQDTWLETTTLPLASSRPVDPASPARESQLKRALLGAIDAPDEIRRGGTAVIAVGEEFAGDWVSAWLYSPPRQLGDWLQVAADGTIEVPVPDAASPGRHRVSVQDADGRVLGWDWTDVLKRPKR